MCNVSVLPVPSHVLPCPCVPRCVPEHGSVPQPHVPLHQRLCRAVPRGAAACSRLSLSVCLSPCRVRASRRAQLCPCGAGGSPRPLAAPS